MTATGRVTGRFVSPLYQGNRPIPVKGTVTFTSQTEYVTTEGEVTTLPTSVVGVLDSQGYLCTPQISIKTHKVLYDLKGNIKPGAKGLTLMATDDPNSNPRNWTWRVDFDFVSVDSTPIKFPSFSFSLPSGEEVDLTTVTPVAGVSGHSTIMGPKGDSVKFLEEQNPEDVEYPENGNIVPYMGEIYGYSDGSWTKLGSVSNESTSPDPKTQSITTDSVQMVATKSSDGLVNLTGSLISDEYILGNLNLEFAPDNEVTMLVFDANTSRSVPFTIFPNGSFQVEPGNYNISVTYKAGGN